MSNDTEYTRLLIGRPVLTSLYQSVQRRVLARAPELDHGRPYRLRKICGEQYWHGLGTQYTEAGRVMADLVERQLVPFLFASDRDEKPLWYWLEP